MEMKQDLEDIQKKFSETFLMDEDFNRSYFKQDNFLWSFQCTEPDDEKQFFENQNPLSNFLVQKNIQSGYIFFVVFHDNLVPSLKKFEMLSEQTIQTWFRNLPYEPALQGGDSLLGIITEDFSQAILLNYSPKNDVEISYLSS